MDKYPDYKQGEVDLIFNKFSPSDKQIIKDFCLYCQTSCNNNKVKDHRRAIIQFKHIIKKDLSNITLEDLRFYLALLNQSNREIWTRHDLRASVKRFLRWKYPDWSNRFNAFKEVKDENIVLNHKKINPQTLLIKSDIEKVMKDETDLTLKTFFITLYESGMRPGELRKIKWVDIKFNVDNDLSEINVFMTKTKKGKTIFIKEATYYLKKLQKESISDYVFYSRENKDLPIADITATRWINQLGKHLNRKLYPYLLRHTRARELYKLADKGQFSEKVVQRFMGHSKSMRDVYSELDSDTIKEALEKSVYQFNDMPKSEREQLQKEISLLKAEQKRIFEHLAKLGSQVSGKQVKVVTVDKTP